MIKVRNASNPSQRAASASTALDSDKFVPHSQAVVNGFGNPINNMGLTVAPTEQQHHEVQLMNDNGTIKLVPVRIPAKNQTSIVDQVSFTFHVSTLHKLGFEPISSQELEVWRVSELLSQIFGYGITSQREGGTNFYHRSYHLGENYGQVGIGGQKDTVLVHLYGLGALKALNGWEQRLHDFLTNVAVRPKITRIDLACDDYEGSNISVDWGLEQYHLGGFTWTGAAPNIEQVGNWIKPTGKGRTLTIGSRSSGKFLRIYEKGKKEGCSSSLWSRFEVEIKSRDRIIPFDALLYPSDYLAGSYPCSSELNTNSERIKTEKTTAQFNLQDSIANTKRQFGKHLRFLRNLLEDSDAALELVMSDDINAMPKRLKLISSDLNTLPQQIHHVPSKKINIDEILFH
ncbi:replication initiation factor domain-containing protein [Paraperlucidibaca sp.]|uniref:replication initiation factor domain-containing protein n=1 Tax=Paraperlucidibaca sp. TaxID=2708021 RepID=UPI0030F4043A